MELYPADGVIIPAELELILRIGVFKQHIFRKGQRKESLRILISTDVEMRSYRIL